VATSNKVKENLAQLLELLDGQSRAILWHLWWHRHAGVVELMELIDAPSAFEVLYRLKEVINVKAQHLWGKPIVSFEQSKVDSLNGENVLFSWWFLGEGNVPMLDGHKPLVDVFNERDGITVIAQLPTSADVNHTDIQFRNGILKIGLRKKEDDEARNGKKKGER
jgi:hypothetical protein